MPTTEEGEMWVALVRIRMHPSLRRGRRALHRSDMVHADFADILKAALRARDCGLTRIRETPKNAQGEVVGIVFEQVLTPAGEAFLAKLPA